MTRKQTVTAELLPYDPALDWAPVNPHNLPWMYRITNPNGNRLIGLTSGNKEQAETRVRKVAEKATQFYHCRLTYNKTITQQANDRRKKACRGGHKRILNNEGRGTRLAKVLA